MGPRYVRHHPMIDAATPPTETSPVVCAFDQCGEKTLNMQALQVTLPEPKTRERRCVTKSLLTTWTLTRIPFFINSDATPSSAD
jgi:hypothetical protein